MKFIERNLLIDFKQYLIQEERSQNTIDKYERDIKKFLEQVSEKEDITKIDVVLFKQHLLDEYKITSINSILVAVNSFLQFFGYHKCTVKLFKLQRRIICEESKELTKAEYERLLKTALNQKNKKLYMLIQTICSTGIRVSEHQYITVEQLKKGQIVISNKGKTRIVFVQKKLRLALLEYCREMGIRSGSVFITRSGKAINRSNIWRMMKELCEEARVEKSKVFPHNLRHLFALTYYRLEKDLVRLADLLGHSSIETTRIYTMTTGHEYERQLSKMRLVDN